MQPAIESRAGQGTACEQSPEAALVILHELALELEGQVTLSAQLCW